MNRYNQDISDELRALLRTRKLRPANIRNLMALSRGILTDTEMGRLYALSGKGVTRVALHEGVMAIVGPYLAPEGN